MDETTPIRKFMFERSFDGSTAANRPPERKPVTLKPEQFDALKKESYDTGYNAGCQVAADQHTQQLATLLSNVTKSMTTLVADMQTQHKMQDAQMRQTIMAIAKKILPTYTGRYGLQEIEKILSDTITEMVHEPRLVLRVNQQQFDSINSHIHEITVQKAYSGKVVVLADTNIAPGDCRVEWADGGLERNTQGLMDDIEAIVTPETTETPS